MFSKASQHRSASIVFCTLRRGVPNGLANWNSLSSGIKLGLETPRFLRLAAVRLRSHFQAIYLFQSVA
jgi:hypothetical protein